MQKQTLALWALLVGLAGSAVASDMGTAFNYQGRLCDGGMPANGYYDFNFKLFDVPTAPGGTLLGEQTLTLALVTNGLVTTNVDFGAVPFAGAARWLEISARSNGLGGYAPLGPRQELKPTPYALFAPTAGNAQLLGGQVPAAFAPASGSSAYVAKAGDTMTGPLILPADGLRAGASQLVLANGHVGIGTTAPGHPLSLGDAFAHTKLALWESSGSAAGLGVTNSDYRLHLGGGLNRFLFLDAPNGKTLLTVSNSEANRADVRLGPVSFGTGGSPGHGARLHFSGGPNLVNVDDNSDPMWMGRYDNDPDSTELRINVGDNPGMSKDSLVIGVTEMITREWIPLFTFWTDGKLGINKNNPATALDVNGTATATAFVGDGSGLTGLNASSLTSGTVPDAQIPTSITRDAEVMPLVLAGDGPGSLLDADTLDGISAGGFWQRGGNAGTTPGTHFLGTLDNQALELKVSSDRALRLSPSGTPGIVGIIGGSSANSVSGAGNTIAGGGRPTNPNTISGASYATIGGGWGHTIRGDGGLIGGGYGNLISSGAAGATIAGGTNNTVGADALFGTISGGRMNRIGDDADHVTISGGYGNSAGVESRSTTVGGGEGNALGYRAYYSVIGGGLSNRMGDQAVSSVIGGGLRNAVLGNAAHAFIGGGADNQIALFAEDSAIAGGVGNLLYPSAARCFIGGGLGNSILQFSSNSVVVGGRLNSIDIYAPNSFIGGGEQNDISSDAYGSVIAGGFYNRIAADSYDATIAGGGRNAISQYSWFGTIGGGENNMIDNNVDNATIAGGGWNMIRPNAGYGVIGGGRENTIAADSMYATIAGGVDNKIGTNSFSSAIGGGDFNGIGDNSAYATIPGGYANGIYADASYSAIGGGYNNTNKAAYATIPGGYKNAVGTASSSSVVGGGSGNAVGDNTLYATIAGGRLNDIGDNAPSSAIGGGYDNTVADDAAYATIPGGLSNFATNYAFAAGRRAKARHTGSFVWADSQDADFLSTAPNQVRFRCEGGVRFASGNAGTDQNVYWAPGNSAWSFSSDRNLKEGFTPVDGAAVLEKVARLPLSEWSFKGYPQRHIGPMAQDFHALFPLNESDTTLNSADLDGVALAALQGLNQKVEEQRQQAEASRQKLEAQNAALAREVVELKALVNALTGKLKAGSR